MTGISEEKERRLQRTPKRLTGSCRQPPGVVVLVAGYGVTDFG
jgi:hypothetical protein